MGSDVGISPGWAEFSTASGLGAGVAAECGPNKVFLYQFHSEHIFQSLPNLSRNRNKTHYFGLGETSFILEA